jgi:hypothetical protein
MRARHFFPALILCALAHAAAAAAPTSAAPTDDTETDGCEVAYAGGEALGAPDYHVPAPPAAAVPAPLDLKEQAALDEQSYVDVYGILKDENECSRFFGGPAHAVEAFNEMSRRIKRKPLGNRAVGVRMSGGFVTYRNHQTGAVYRLFDEATVNSDGPFFKRFAEPGKGNKPTRVGSFRAVTRQGRALMFLHELGHVVARAGGEWLLPNDGNDRELSERNTRTVEKNCADELTALGE